MANRTIVLPKPGTAIHVLADWDVQNELAMTVCGELCVPQVVFEAEISSRAICGQCARSLRGNYGWRSFVEE